jgi:hypothetical protein
MHSTDLTVFLLPFVLVSGLAAQIIPRQLQEEETRSKLEKIMRAQEKTPRDHTSSSRILPGHAWMGSTPRCEEWYAGKKSLIRFGWITASSTSGPACGSEMDGQPRASRPDGS